MGLFKNMNPALNPTTPNMTSAPKNPTGSITPIPQAQASYTSGQMLPQVGTPEYDKAQQMAQQAIPKQQAPQVPAGWDQMTYDSFKRSNPTLEPDAQDTAMMQNAGNSPEDISASQKYAADTAANDANTAQANESFQKYVKDMQNGSIPLNPYEQAQLDATTNSFNSIIDAQKLANKNYEGGVTVANEAMGLSRYSPQMAQGEILSAVSEGNKKVADLNLKMQQSLLSMQQGFQENKYSSIKDAYTAFLSAQKEKTNTIENTYKVAAAKEKAAVAAQQDQYYGQISSLIGDDSFSLPEKKAAISQAMSLGLLTTDQVKDVQAQLKDANKGIEDIAKSASENGASPKQINAILSSRDLNEAYQNASGLLGKDKTGPIGEYEYYVNQERANGRSPLSFMDFKNYSTNATIGAGINPITGQPLTKAEIDTQNKVKDLDEQDLQTARGAYSTIEGILKKYKATPDTVTPELINSMTDSDAEAIGRASARVTTPDINRMGGDAGNSLDPTSAVEKLEQNKRALLGGQKYLPSKVVELISTTKASYDARKQRVGNPVASQISQNEDIAQNVITDFATSHPDMKEGIAKLLETPDPAFGNKPPTHFQVLQALRKRGLIQ